MRRVLVGVSIALVAVLSSAGISSATTVSYIDGKAVWVNSLDGKQKYRLAAPATDGRVWSEQAQSDNGKVVAVRREPGKMATLNSFTLFGSTGKVLQQGSLTAENGWISYAYPVSLDLTNGGIAVYGYANWTGFGLSTVYGFGTYIRTVEKPFYIEPFDLEDWQWPTLYGNRLVVTQGNEVWIESTASGNPFSNGPDVGFLSVPSGYDVNRTDVAANGKLFAIELDYNTIELYPIDRVPDTGQSSTVGSGGCVLPTQGDANHVSLSQDGKSVAWEDDRGVLVAGVPDFGGADPCHLTRAPVVIASNGGYPSIGAATIPGSGGSLVPKPSVPKTVKAAKLKTGIWITVRVGKAGPVKITGKVGKTVVARGSARAKKVGKVKVKLKAVGAFRNRPQRLKGRTLVIKVTSAGKSKTVRRVLK